jgi:hypothetical protein
MVSLFGGHDEAPFRVFPKILAKPRIEFQRKFQQKKLDLGCEWVIGITPRVSIIQRLKDGILEWNIGEASDGEGVLPGPAFALWDPGFQRFPFPSFQGILLGRANGL